MMSSLPSLNAAEGAVVQEVESACFDIARHRASPCRKLLVKTEKIMIKTKVPRIRRNILIRMSQERIYHFRHRDAACIHIVSPADQGSVSNDLCKKQCDLPVVQDIDALLFWPTDGQVQIQYT